MTSRKSRDREAVARSGDASVSEREVARADDAGASVTQGDTEEPRSSLLRGSSAELESRLAEAESQRDEYLADLQRLAAEYENYRKRAAREQERLVAHAHERLVRELLPVLDDLERALEEAERHEEAALADGVRLVERALRNALAKEGLAEISTDGPFDPHVHEALMTRPQHDAEPGSVLEVVQRGYRLGDRVVRPARVVVAAESPLEV